jgi:ribosomal protein L40E
VTDIPHTLVPVSLCPRCGARNDAATEITGEAVAPREGDFSVCLSCGCISRFRADRTLRECSLVELGTDLDPEERRVLLGASLVARSLGQP